MKKMTQKEKTKFRVTKEWKQLRTEKQAEQKNLDALTLKPLRKGANLHHLDLDSEHYTDISDTSRFVLLNKAQHELIHTLFRYYMNDRSYLDRVKELLDKMAEINEKNY